MTAGVFLLALAQSALFFGIGRVVADLVRPRPPQGDAEDPSGSAEDWLLACLGFSAWAVILMLGHIVSGGRVFSNPVVVPVATIALVVVWTRRRAITWARPRLRWPVIALGALLLALYLAPAVIGGSSLRTGDPPWHLGWTEQVLDGQSVPTGPAPIEVARNAYPWGLHAVFATLVRSVPGSDPVIGHEALHLVLIVAIPLAAACLARLVNRRAGLAAAAVAGLVGGFGWVGAGSPDFVASPRAALYGADLVAASPNSVYELLPPALPRELGLVLLACAGVLLAGAFTRITHDRRRAVIAGAAVGIVGLVSVPMVISALGWTVAWVVMRHRRALTGAIVIGVALGTFALWAVPVAIDFVRFDGFVSVTPRLGVEWPLGTALASWGLLLPLALGGIVVAASQPPVVRRPLMPLVGVAVLLLVLSIARGHFDWGLLGNETLLHQGRFWPPAHLLASALGGIGLVALHGWIRPRALAIGMAVGILAVGAISPVFASIGLTRIIADEADGFLYGSDDLKEGSFVRRAAAHMDSDDVVRGDGGELLSLYLFQFSGVRIASESGRPIPENPWRIRFTELAARWYERASTDDFPVDWVAIKQISGDGFTETGTFRDERWGLLSTHE